MSTIGIKEAKRPKPDDILVQIADYIMDYEITSIEALETARYCLMDTIGCGLLALNYPACVKMMGPVVPGAHMQDGSRVPGTSYQLDPVTAAFNIGCQIRWLDFNDTWLAAEWGHPSDNLGGILAVDDYLSQKNNKEGKKPLQIKDVFIAMIKAHEIQGVLALENSFNQVGLDHVLLVRVATCGVVAKMLGADKKEIINSLSQAWVDGCALRTYRHAPNAGSRKSWAAGDATSRAVRLALISLKGEMGYPSALTAKDWGYYDVLFGGREFKIPRPFQSYVMENILFKIAYPAEFHAQTAVECAMQLHEQVKDRLDDIDKIFIESQEAGIRIIDKCGTLNNPADRDHCLQYMIAIPLIFGRLTADDYEDDIAADKRVDALREKMIVTENPRYTEEYFDLDKRYIGNSVEILFKDGSHTDKIEVNYPIGHRKRRSEGIPLLLQKFEQNLRGRIPQKQADKILTICHDQQKFEDYEVQDFMELLHI